jgi:hypothetical protein
MRPNCRYKRTEFEQSTRFSSAKSQWGQAGSSAVHLRMTDAVEVPPTTARQPPTADHRTAAAHGVRDACCLYAANHSLHCIVLRVQDAHYYQGYGSVTH